MNTNQSMYGFIKEAVQNYDAVKIRFYNTSLTAGELFRDIELLACFLQKNRLQRGESVGICLPNFPQAVVALYAVNLAGGVANILHPKLGTRALLDALQKTNTKILFLYDRFIATHNKHLKKAGITVISCRMSDYLKGTQRLLFFAEPIVRERNVIAYRTALLQTTAEFSQIDGEDDAVYLHSSGTMGEPKTVRLSSRAFNELAYNIYYSIMANHAVVSEDKMLMVLPMFHGFGLGVCVHLAMFYFCIAMQPVFRAKKVIKLMKKESIEMFAGVPGMFYRLYRAKGFYGAHLSSLKLLFCGGDKLDAEFRQKFDAALRENGSKACVMEGFGLSEAASVTHINVTGKQNNSLGQPIQGVSVLILDENGEECPVGEFGEVLIASATLMNGYLGEHSPCFTERDGIQYLRTGDIGSVDNEGYFYFKERKKRMIKIGGVNIYPREIEETVCKIAGVRNACVLRTEVNGRPATKLLVETDGKKGEGFARLLKHEIRKQILPYAVPKEIIFVEKLALTALGKVDYKKYETMQSE